MRMFSFPARCCFIPVHMKVKRRHRDSLQLLSELCDWAPAGDGPAAITYGGCAPPLSKPALHAPEPSKPRFSSRRSLAVILKNKVVKGRNNRGAGINRRGGARP